MSTAATSPTSAPPLTMQATVAGQVAAVLGDDVVATQWFHPAGRWNAGVDALRRGGRALTGRRRVDDALPLMAVMAVTSSSVVVFRAAITAQGFTLGEQVREWPRREVTGTFRHVERSTSGTDGTRMHFKAFRQARLDTPDGRLWADLPDRERGSLRLVAALGLVKQG